MVTLAGVGAALQGLGAVAGMFGGGSDRKSAERAQYNEMLYQKEILRHQIPLMVAGAKEAGIHPLAAIGVNPASSGVISSVGSTDSYSKADRFADMSQNIGRAIQAYTTKEERVVQQTKDKLLLENASLQNDLLRAQITNISKPTNPPLPVQGTADFIAGQGDSPLVEVLPSMRTSNMRNAYDKEAAIAPANKAFVNADGTISIWPSSDAKQSIEDSPYELEHIWSNRFIPWLNKTFGKSADRFLDDREQWRRARDKTRKYW